MKKMLLFFVLIIFFLIPISVFAENVNGWFQEFYAMGKKISVGDKIPFFSDTEEYDTLYGELLKILPDRKKIYGTFYRKGIFRLCGEKETKTKSPAIDFKGYCSSKWHSDYVMQKHCCERQEAAFWEYIQIDRSYPGDTEETQIIRRCTKKWTTDKSHVDWVMVVHCIKRQIEAYKKLYK